MSSEGGFGYASSSSFPTAGSSTQHFQFDDDDIEAVLSENSRSDTFPTPPSLTSTIPTRIVPLTSATTYGEAALPYSEELYDDNAQGIWTTAEGYDGWPAPAGWSAPPTMGYHASQAFPNLPYGPDPLPIDQFGSQQPYPYALERVSDMPSWNNLGVPAIGQETPFMLFPSSAHTMSSAQTLMERPVLPVAYEPKPYVASNHILPPPINSAPNKRLRKDLSPSPEQEAHGSVIRFQTIQGHTAPVQHIPASRNKRAKVRRQGRTDQSIREQINPHAPSSRESASLGHQGDLDAVRPQIQGSTSLILGGAKQRPTRKGPLTEFQKEKMEAVRHHGACWRCRRYKKPCNAGAAICNNCLTSGLRLWPGSIGCRRGDFGEFAMTVLPDGMEDIMRNIYPLKSPKPNSVRRLKAVPTDITFYLTQHHDDKWENLYTKIQCLEIFGPELIDLLRIMERLAKSHKQHNNLLETVATSLSLTADFHWCFVSTVTPLPEPDLLKTISTLRAACVKAWNGILSTCLSGKMSSWPAAFLSACMVVFSLVIYSETIILIPPDTRSSVWVDARSMFYDLRNHLYSAVTEMLVILAKGAKPLQFKCWTSEDSVDSEGNKIKIRNEEGLRIFKGDEASFDAMGEIQQWTGKYRDMLENDSWFSSTPLTPVGLRALHPIAAVSRFVIRTGGAYNPN